eukprot:CAMPEP_0183292410 /NCGR_PEP_ID=MMETSP0160_2-20130417/1472_1 /TAXON_ID=2839 ORGANISM="Odontella Sinensis, Strain Grunow 1884" /NCGR_SAMPLE_ID=MMETSP0160_2 /ASSEMBLY_ACC=CAM_ASM_000250 /LENGTH=369 /DNA_ID=CAMNT_0025453353 /DNA_START=155 /DNA_END=1264 /DNA_ORIENTATION=+
MRSTTVPPVLLFVVASALVALVSSAAAAAAAAAGPAFGGRGIERSVFGVVPRGGGLFGGKKEEADAPAASGEATKYPALTEEEIEEWLAHIPVFAVTDSKGSGVVLRPDNDTSVFYFFMSPQMANATLQTLKASNEDVDLRISAFSLGKIWFKMLEGEGAEVKLRTPGSDSTDADADADAESASGVQYRLVPDTRDLMGARMLLTMDPADGERLKAGGEFSAEDAQKAVAKAMTDSPKFKNNYNEIPVFMIQQMRLAKQAPDGEDKSRVLNEEPPAAMLPMYFSLQNMVGTWQQFLSQAPGDVQDVEPAINLMELHELVDLMRKESEIDFRNTILIPPVPMGAGGPEGTEAKSEEEQLAGMGGDTLGDL